MKKKVKFLLPLVLIVSMFVSGCSVTDNAPVVVEYNGTSVNETSESSSVTSTEASSDASAGNGPVSLTDIPEYSGDAYIAIDGNIPGFSEADLTTSSFESYSELDLLGRCGSAYACIGTDTMPTEDRGDISDVYPTGWEQKQYDFVDGGYIYNRCHLIGFQLTGENDNEQNLITGTRYMNTEGMLPFENMVADYIKETGNHVLYRVTPVFEGDNLLASGVQMEAMSVEDNGDGILFNVYCYNVQPGITINYATGENWLEGTNAETSEDGSYILNTNSMKFHKPDCSGVANMSERNKEEYTGSRTNLIEQGYSPCGICNP